MLKKIYTDWCGGPCLIRPYDKILTENPYEYPGKEEQRDEKMQAVVHTAIKQNAVF